MTIKLEDITTGEVAGRGFYDELMRTTLAHIEQEHTAGRITDQNYSTVYLGAIQANLDVAARVVLQYELNNADLLIKQESLDNTVKQGLLLDAQIAQMEAQTALLSNELLELRPKQSTQLDNQNALLSSQNLGQIEQNKLIATQELGQVAQNLVTGKQEDLIDEQIKTEATNTVNATGGLAKASLDKSQAEVAILNQKQLTEEAQTVGTTATIGGLIGAEMSLKEEQKESFLRDAEQKAAKFYADMLSIAYSTAPDDAYNDPAAWGFGQVESNKVTTKLLAGINA